MSNMSYKRTYQGLGRQAHLTVPCPREAELILAYAMMQSLADDLGALRRDGFWQQDPNEMLLHPQACYPRYMPGGSFNTMLSSTWLLKELQSEGVQVLYDIIKAASEGRVRVGRGTVVRMAKQASAVPARGQPKETAR